MAKKNEETTSTPTGFEIGDTVGQVRCRHSVRLNVGSIDIFEVGEPQLVQRGSVVKVQSLTLTQLGVLAVFHPRGGMPDRILIPWPAVEFVIPPKGE